MVICITGKACSGKSYTSNYLSNKYGFRYIDLDRYLSDYLKDTFNNDFLISIKSELSNDSEYFNIFFQSSINILKKIIKKVSSSNDNVIFSFTLVKEFKLDSLFDYIFLLDVKYDIRLSRYKKKYNIICSDFKKLETLFENEYIDLDYNYTLINNNYVNLSHLDSHFNSILI